MSIFDFNHTDFEVWYDLPDDVEYPSSFERVPNIDFDDDAEVRVVKCVPAPPDETEW